MSEELEVDREEPTVEDPVDTIGDTTDEVREARHNGGGTSLMDRLRQRRSEIAEPHTLTLEIPGYRGELRCRYRYVDWADLMKIAEKVEKSRNPLKLLMAQADTLIKACDEILVVEDGIEHPMAEVLGLDEPVRYDGAGGVQLAEQFGIPANSARQVVRGIFNNDLALTQQHNEVAEWMQDRSREVDDDFLGESETA